MSVKRFNDYVAMRVTLIFGSMWTTYAFFLYGFLPLMFPKDEVNLLYWSNTVQLWSLPLLMVGTYLLGRKAEARAQQDHEAILAEFATLKEMQTMQAEELATLRAINQRLSERHERLVEGLERVANPGVRGGRL